MENTSWLKQTPDKPLFPDLLWSRPENKSLAGKLLVIGGNLYGFTAPAKALEASEKAGIGTARVILPDKLHKTLGRLFPDAEFAPSTPSGSFSRQALAELLERTDWADGLLLAGDFGKNSETAILLESLLQKTSKPAIVSGDAVDYFLNSTYRPLERKNTAILADFSRLQAMAKHKRVEMALTHSMGLYELVKALSSWSINCEAVISTQHAGQVAIAYNGKVSTTPVKEIVVAELSAYLSVWQLQNEDQPFEALSSAAFEFSNN